MLMTGDTLFVGSCGRTDLPDSDEVQMFSSLARLSTLGPSVLVLPGHNYAELPFTTIGAERAQNVMVIRGLQQIPRPPPLPPCAICDNCGACGPKGFVIGRKVFIKGLSSDAGKPLNGQAAVVQQFATDKERYSVRLLSSPDVKALKPDNLEKPSPDTEVPFQELPPPPDDPTPREFIDAALALIDGATDVEREEWRKLGGDLDWTVTDPRWPLLKERVLKGGSVRATFGTSIGEVVKLLKLEFDPKWRAAFG